MGVTNVDAMLAGMTAKCFYGWQAYDALEPFTEQREDTRNAWIVKALWDIARDTKKHPEPFQIKDFLLNFEEKDREEDRKTVEQDHLVGKLKMFTAMLESQSDEERPTVRQGDRHF